MTAGQSLESRFETHVLSDVHMLKDRYDPKLFLRMVSEHGAVGTAKRLLADPRHTPRTVFNASTNWGNSSAA